MNLIITSHNIKNELVNPGYSVIPAEELYFSPVLDEEKAKFLKDWNKLEIDNHMMDGGKYRLRRYGRFTFDNETEKLDYQGEVKYFQTEELNTFAGGQVRKFAPLFDETVQNNFLRELILFDFNQLPIKDEFQNIKWNVGIHQIRILAEPGKKGQPAPEGIHKDGEMYTVQHLIERKNIEGGENAAYDNDKNRIAKWMQSQRFDSYYFEDDVIYHSVSQVTSKDESSIGYRDVLLIDFDPIKD
ncbi:MAG: hypothetical protein HeimC2_41740 [Candidatus Heimdallarchaeota archaeon LC_2]|nr:MAG: hypothetical protein HeimC2_41740 [Candidatus Heimdallarchaeota archaeon LC_2]